MKLWHVLFLALYFVLSFGIVNLGFPIRHYFTAFAYQKSYVVSSFILLCFFVTSFTAVALPLSTQGKRPLWARAGLATAVQFFLVAGFAIACSGLGFGWSLGGSTLLSRLSLFFMEFEWLRFIFQTAVPLAVCAALLYYCTGRTYVSRS